MIKKARTKATLFLGLSIMFLSGCAEPWTNIEGQAKAIEIRIDTNFDPQECQWLGDITGSEGHWYSYIFFPNDIMIRGAINDLRNNAQAIGANTVFMISPQDFRTSFTVLGIAYQCP
ncbi:DUF4156 domain-containing protein [Vibrio sp. FNV 38]|nr:DUF4156 domain-containing protein [Vibrio sp. FNV 38]